MALVHGNGDTGGVAELLSLDEQFLGAFRHACGDVEAGGCSESEAHRRLVACFDTANRTISDLEDEYRAVAMWFFSMGYHSYKDGWLADLIEKHFDTVPDFKDQPMVQRLNSASECLEQARRCTPGRNNVPRHEIAAAGEHMRQMTSHIVWVYAELIRLCGTVDFYCQLGTLVTPTRIDEMERSAAYGAWLLGFPGTMQAIRCGKHPMHIFAEDMRMGAMYHGQRLASLKAVDGHLGLVDLKLHRKVFYLD